MKMEWIKLGHWSHGLYVGDFCVGYVSRGLGKEPEFHGNMNLPSRRGKKWLHKETTFETAKLEVEHMARFWFKQFGVDVE